MSFRILFAAHSCYLDDSNGASVFIRMLLEALADHGFIVEAFTGTVFESKEIVQLTTVLNHTVNSISSSGRSVVTTNVNSVLSFETDTHSFVLNGVHVTLSECMATTNHTAGNLEIAKHISIYNKILDRFSPDIVLNFGGDHLAHEIRLAARHRSIKVAFSLNNYNYTDKSPFHTCDSVFLPSEFAQNFYRKKLGLNTTAIPYLIDTRRAVCSDRTPKYVTFINPSYEKGVYFFCRLADELGQLRPDIPFLVVESRGSESTLASCGLDLRRHGNVFFMSQTTDPKDFWRHTKLCVMPSLWWESQPLTAIEAMLNGIPVLGSDRGGIPETLGTAGFTFPISDRLSPSSRELPSAFEVKPWIDCIIHLYDSQTDYNSASHRSCQESQRWETASLTKRYVDYFSTLCQDSASNPVLDGEFEGDIPIA